MNRQVLSKFKFLWKRTCRFTEVYINDKMRLGRLVKSIAILGAQKFFTPNGTDLTIIGTGQIPVLNSMCMFIFDRYGSYSNK
jgi:hypothetical protein